MDRETVIKELEKIRIYTMPPHEFCVLTNAIELLKEQEAEIRQLRLALDIAKGTCNGIVVEGR